ncbi:hypothetical protein MNBD_GAMMA22-42 [hydrothermal vent metagenome]|uniref:Glutamine cyclotransferase n=1 Tax=hydrothermal vent metagenome TaxID=652676 RepID=A0A3B0ZUE5_9ZZZZ
MINIFLFHCVIKKLNRLFSIVILITFPVFSLANESKPLKQQCSAVTIEQQQRNAPNKLISFDSENLPAELKNNYIPVKQFNYKIINRLFHDQKSFTQGLVIFKNHIFESVGLLGQSKIQKLDIETGEVTQYKKLKKYLFAEGVSVLNDNLVQLTWKTERILSYSSDNLVKISEDKIHGEGWGVTSINDQLIVSDGSATLQVLDSNKIIIKRLLVSSQGKLIRGLNELEYASGHIYANVWPTDCIAKINPDTGGVVAWINLQGLFPREKRPHWTAILNGIAYHKESNSFFVTGKFWPYIFEIKFQNEVSQLKSMQLTKTDVNKFNE